MSTFNTRVNIPNINIVLTIRKPKYPITFL